MDSRFLYFRALSSSSQVPRILISKVGSASASALPTMGWAIADITFDLSVCVGIFSGNAQRLKWVASG